MNVASRLLAPSCCSRLLPERVRHRRRGRFDRRRQRRSHQARKAACEHHPACRRQRPIGHHQRRGHHPIDGQSTGAHARGLCRARAGRAASRRRRRSRAGDRFYGGDQAACDAGRDEPGHTKSGAGIGQRRMAASWSTDLRFLSDQSGDSDNVINILGSPASLPRTLVVEHRHDDCPKTLPAGVDPFIAWAHGRAHAAWLDGGISEGDPCEAMAHHGFNGIDGKVVSRGWPDSQVDDSGERSCARKTEEGVLSFHRILR